VFVVRRPIGAMLVALVAGAAVLTGCLIGPSESKAARGMELALQDDAVYVQGKYPRIQGDGSKPYGYARALGVTRLRTNVLWAYTLPPSEYGAKKKPAVLHYDFSVFDRLIDRAAAAGIRVHASLTGPAPRWANARHYGERKAWFKPNATEFGKFAAVAAQHFKGRVDRYSIWNEPNWKTWLGPLKSGPALYRYIYKAGYNAIKSADPAAKVLIGETAPVGRKGKSTSPLKFLRGVTCVNAKYKRAKSCPKLKADGYAHHPYDFAHAPNYRYPGSDNATLGTLSRLTTALDKLKRAGVLRKNGGGRMPVYLTEYGYFASGHRALKKRLRVKYLKQGQSLALKNKRVRSQLQYLLVSPPRSQRASFFDLGLMNTKGKKNAGFNALRAWYVGHRGKVKRPGAGIALPPAPPQPTV
jgi:hypothetical protein